MLNAYRPDQHRELAQRFGQDPGAQTLGYICILLWVLGLPDQAACYAEAAEIAAEKSAMSTQPVMSRGTCRHTPCAVARVESSNGRSGPSRLWRRYITCQCFEPCPIAWKAYCWPSAASKPGWLAFSQLSPRCWQVVCIYTPLFAIEQAKALIGLRRLGEARTQVDLGSTCWPGPANAGPLPKSIGWMANSSVRRAIFPSPSRRFERAIQVARQQEARSWELRATMSLARLWADSGERSRAR